MLAAADSLGCELIVLSARTEGEFERAFTTLIERGGGALVAASDPLLTGSRDKLIALAARQKIPAIYTLREYAADGGLMSYGASQVDTWRKAAGYVARILNGARPSDLPIQLPIKYDLVINARTAKALGLTIPETLLATADEVIE
jgi:putative ABC transport system substrate-binding protein